MTCLIVILYDSKIHQHAYNDCNILKMHWGGVPVVLAFCAREKQETFTVKVLFFSEFCIPMLALVTTSHTYMYF